MSAPGLDIILVGVGGAAARFVAHSAAGHRGMRALVFDCDAATRDIAGDAEFVEIGAARLDGRSSGGDAVKARTAAQDDAAAIRDAVSGARLAVVAASLGGGFASGALPEILKTMRDAGVTTVCVATTPFAFEGADRAAAARRAVPLVEDAAHASALVALDDLFSAKGGEPVGEAWDSVAGTVSSMLSLFWEMAVKPGFISLGTERIVSAVADSAGRFRIAASSAAGEGRASSAAAALLASPLCGGAKYLEGISAAIIGVVAGKDLRLAEMSDVSGALTSGIPSLAKVDVGVVVDEGREGEISLVGLFFENGLPPGGAEAPETAPSAPEPRGSRRGHRRDPLAADSAGARFKGTEDTIYNGQNLDLPTYRRRNLPLEK